MQSFKYLPTQDCPTGSLSKAKATRIYSLMGMNNIEQIINSLFHIFDRCHMKTMAPTAIWKRWSPNCHMKTMATQLLNRSELSSTLIFAGIKVEALTFVSFFWPPTKRWPAQLKKNSDGRCYHFSNTWYIIKYSIWYITEYGTWKIVPSSIYQILYQILVTLIRKWSKWR